MKSTRFPEDDFSDTTDRAISAWLSLHQHFETSFGIPFAPSASVGWDSSPRTLRSDPFGPWGYPWTSRYAAGALMAWAAKLSTYLFVACSDCFLCPAVCTQTLIIFRRTWQRSGCIWTHCARGGLPKDKMQQTGGAPQFYSMLGTSGPKVRISSRTCAMDLAN